MAAEGRQRGKTGRRPKAEGGVFPRIKDSAAAERALPLLCNLFNAAGAFERRAALVDA